MLVGIVVCLLGTAPRAKAVDQWTWFSHPYAYFMAEQDWGYFNPNDSQWCYDFALGGQWSRLGQNVLANGWVYLTYPYAYSLPAARWFYLNEADTPWVYYFGGATWRRLDVAPAPAGMVLIPAGVNSGMNPDFGAYSLTNSTSFYMDRYEVTKALWDEVKNWSGGNGYNYNYAGESKAANHPVHTVSWCDCVKWCNARSQKDGRTPVYYTDATMTQVFKTGWLDDPYVKSTANGYRLPSDVQWEYAARGGVASLRFPWGDMIDHDRANYYNPTRGYHPAYNDGVMPYTSPVGSFAPNGYGLYDMAGNVSELCYDWYYGTSCSYPSRVERGGSWSTDANYCKVCVRAPNFYPATGNFIGFRTCLP
jgi:formylglycine-generating enzyme required for sulfatase activity